VVRTAIDEAPEVAAAGRLAASLAVLMAARRGSQRPVDDLLLQPQVGGWGARCLRRLRRLRRPGRPGPPGPPGPPRGLDGSQEEATLADDLGYLGALAAVAALLADMPVDVLVRVRDGGVMFPTMGLLRLSGGPSWARVRGADRGLVVSTPTGSAYVPWPRRDGVASASWLPLRRLRGSADGQRIAVTLDDLDPFRGFGDLPEASRLDEATVARWQHRLDGAWTILVRRHPARAAAMAPALMSLVPLQSIGRRFRSATSRDAFGGVALTLPRSDMEFAAALVHEFQHVKLGGLLDLVDLYNGPEPPTLYAPWRPDARPLSGLLQGTYAYLAISEFWEATRRTSQPAFRPTAHFEFAWSRLAVQRTLRTLTASDALTALGRRFVDGMSAPAAKLAGAPVPEAVLRLARQTALDHLTAWRLRNLRVDPDQVADWADAWLGGAPAPRAGRPRLAMRAASRGPLPDPRLELVELRLRDPERFQRLAGEPSRFAASVPDVTVADVLYVAGDWAEAAVAYRREITLDPDRAEVWAGFVLAARATTLPGLAWPEALRDLHTEIRSVTGTGVDPLTLAAWLAPALGPAPADPG
jgi:HEXXH motif-containing protein